MRPWIWIPALSPAGSMTSGTTDCPWAAVPPFIKCGWSHDLLGLLWELTWHETCPAWVWHITAQGYLLSSFTPNAHCKDNNGNSSHLLSPYLLPETVLSTLHVPDHIFLFLYRKQVIFLASLKTSILTTTGLPGLAPFQQNLLILNNMVLKWFLVFCHWLILASLLAVTKWDKTKYCFLGF